MLQVFVLSNCADLGLIQKELSKVNGVDSGVGTMDGTHDGIFNVHARLIIGEDVKTGV